VKNLNYLDSIPEPDMTIDVLDGPTSSPDVRQREQRNRRVEPADLRPFDDRRPRSVDLGIVDEAPPTIAGREVGWVHPMRRKKTARRVDPYAPGRMRAEVAIDAPSAPEAVVAAQQSALAAIDAFEEAGRRVKDVGQDAQDERIDHEAAVAKAYRNGDAIPELKATDWVAEETIRKIQYGEAFDAAKIETARFRVTYKAAQPEWLSALVHVVEPSHARAREAVLVAAEALGEWRAAVNAADAMSQAAGVYGPAWNQSPSGINVGIAMDGVQKLVQLVESDDPVVSGAFLTTPDELSPPSWTREALRRKAERGVDYARVATELFEQADREGTVASIARGNNLDL
jgi:hypothetical protein